MVRIGERLRALREALDITQQELADRVKRSRVTISQYEVGSRRFPSDDVELFARALGVSPSVLFDPAIWKPIDDARAEVERALAEVRRILREARGQIDDPEKGHDGQDDGDGHANVKSSSKELALQAMLVPA